MSDARLAESGGLKQIGLFEAGMLRVLRYMLHQGPPDRALPVLDNRFPVVPDRLSENALHLLRDSLRKGCVLYLVRAGGWKREKALRNGEVVEGRLWERSTADELKLVFSRRVLDLLWWLTGFRPGEHPNRIPTTRDEPSTGDELLRMLVWEGCRGKPELLKVFRTQEMFAANPLCWLMFPEDFAVAEGEPNCPDFSSWMSGPRSLILEAMQTRLEERWVQLERSRGQQTDWVQMNQQSRAVAATLSQFLDACERSGRVDLARFLLRTLRRIFSTELSPNFWIGGLISTTPMRMADRIETQRAALCTVRAVRRMHRWEQTSRSRGFYDEEYRAAKYWLGEWERHDGDTTLTRCEAVLQQIEPFRNTDPVV